MFFDFAYGSTLGPLFGYPDAPAAGRPLPPTQVVDTPHAPGTGGRNVQGVAGSIGVNG